MVSRFSDKMTERRDNTFTLERNILGVPTFVLNSKSATKLQNLKHSWQTSRGEVKYVFFRQSETPFPQLEHSRYFDILVGIFAKRINSEGHLWFSFAEVMRVSGQKLTRALGKQS